MPALQVRDFPDDLYQQLKTSAKREHRSLAQQATSLIERGLSLVECNPVQESLQSRTTIPYRLRSNAPEEIERRIEKRKALFARIDEMNARRDKTHPRLTDEEIASLVREGRADHRDDFAAIVEELEDDRA